MPESQPKDKAPRWFLFGVLVLALNTAWVLLRMLGSEGLSPLELLLISLYPFLVLLAQKLVGQPLRTHSGFALLLFTLNVGVALLAGLLATEVYNVLKPLLLWAYALIATLPLILLLSLGGNSIPFRSPSPRQRVVASLGYAFPLAITACLLASALVYINCHFDRSAPTDYEVRIIGRQTYGGDPYGPVDWQVYTLTLAPWEAVSEPQTLDVSTITYHLQNRSGYVTVEQYPGRLGIPWYKLESP